MSSTITIPETVNIHFWPRCNLRCTYCFAHLAEHSDTLPVETWRHIIEHLRALGVVRVNFAGGEPTLYRDLTRVVTHARSIGLATSIVSNGARVTDELLAVLDMVGLSIDSADDDVAARLGRVGPRRGSYREHIEAVARRVHRAGVTLKINAVVTALNVGEDLSALYRGLRPWKVKLLQFDEVVGENDDVAPGLRVTREQFEAFVRRHASLAADGIWVQPESEEMLASTYAMLDPAGCVRQQTRTGLRTSRPLNEIDLPEALAEVGGYDRAGFVARGGRVNVRRLPVVHRGAL
jgi:radical S-adenosyl methionine domain-containing protein 2